MRKFKARKNRKPPRIASLLQDNWDADEAPAVVLNPEAPLTSQLAWTWSETKALEKIAEKISDSNNQEAASTACIFPESLESHHRAVGLPDLQPEIT